MGRCRESGKPLLASWVSDPLCTDSLHGIDATTVAFIGAVMLVEIGVSRGLWTSLA